MLTTRWSSLHLGQSWSEITIKGNRQSRIPDVWGGVTAHWLETGVSDRVPQAWFWKVLGQVQTEISHCCYWNGMSLSGEKVSLWWHCEPLGSKSRAGSSEERATVSLPLIMSKCYSYTAWQRVCRQLNTAETIQQAVDPTAQSRAQKICCESRVIKVTGA